GSGWRSVKVASLVSRAQAITDRLLNNMYAKPQPRQFRSSTKEELSPQEASAPPTFDESQICSMCSKAGDLSVVLGCSHRLCFHCLTGQPCFGSSCPSCQREHDLDLASWALDSVLARFVEIRIDPSTPT